MQTEEIDRIHAEHWRVGFGSVAADEAAVMQELVQQYRPRSFIEIGTASGLSGGLLCRMLDEVGGERFVTLDHDNTFFGDTTKENGFLLPLIYPDGGRVEVVRRPFTLATAVPASGEAYDMAFVDANHQHPWPIMDTLCLYPAMSGSKIVMHHDLDLYRKQSTVYGIGPKYLWDQFPETHRWRAPMAVNHGNLFWISLDLPREQLEEIAADALALPWSMRSAMNPPRLDGFRAVLDQHYTPALREVFEECAAKFNAPMPVAATG